MTTGPSRRAVLVNAFALPMLAGLAARVAGAETALLKYGQPQRFSFEWLKDEAKRLAGVPFADVPARGSDILDKLGYDDHNTIRIKPDHSLWADGGGPFPVQFFHLGKWFQLPVKIHLVEGGEAREILYSPEFFTFTRQRWDQMLPPDLG